MTVCAIRLMTKLFNGMQNCVFCPYIVCFCASRKKNKPQSVKDLPVLPYRYAPAASLLKIDTNDYALSLSQTSSLAPSTAFCTWSLTSVAFDLAPSIISSTEALALPNSSSPLPNIPPTASLLFNES